MLREGFRIDWDKSEQDHITLQGDFYDGLPADSYEEEDIKIDFGDPEEKLLKEVLYYIENEKWTGSGTKKSERVDWRRMRGINSLTGAI